MSIPFLIIITVSDFQMASFIWLSCNQLHFQNLSIQFGLCKFDCLGVDFFPFQLWNLYFVPRLVLIEKVSTCIHQNGRSCFCLGEFHAVVSGFLDDNGFWYFTRNSPHVLGVCRSIFDLRVELGLNDLEYLVLMPQKKIVISM